MYVPASQVEHVEGASAELNSWFRCAERREMVSENVKQGVVSDEDVFSVWRKSGQW